MPRNSENAKFSRHAQKPKCAPISHWPALLSPFSFKILFVLLLYPLPAVSVDANDTIVFWFYEKICFISSYWVFSWPMLARVNDLACHVTVCHKYFCDVKTDDTQSILLSIFLQMREFLTMLLIFGVLQATTKTPRKTRRQETSAREEVPKRTQMSRIPPTSRKIRRS